MSILLLDYFEFVPLLFTLKCVASILLWIFYLILTWICLASFYPWNATCPLYFEMRHVHSTLDFFTSFLLWILIIYLWLWICLAPLYFEMRQALFTLNLLSSFFTLNVLSSFYFEFFYLLSTLKFFSTLNIIYPLECELIFCSVLLPLNFISTFDYESFYRPFWLWICWAPFHCEMFLVLFTLNLFSSFFLFFSTENELGDLFTRVFSTKNKLGDFLRGIFNQKWIRDICYVGFFCHRHRVWGGAVLLAKIDEGEIVFQAVYSVLPCLYCTEWGNIQLPLHGIFSTKML